MKHTKGRTKKNVVYKKRNMKGGAIISISLDEFIAAFERNYDEIKRAGQNVVLTTIISATISEIINHEGLSRVAQSGMEAAMSAISSLSSALVFSEGVLNVSMDATGNVLSTLTSGAFNTLYGFTLSLGSTLQNPVAAAAFGATTAAVGTTAMIDPNLLKLRPMLALAYSLLLRMGIVNNTLAIENGPTNSQDEQAINGVVDELNEISSTVSSNVSSQANTPVSSQQESQQELQGNLNLDNLNHNDLQAAAEFVTRTIENNNAMEDLIKSISERKRTIEALLTDAADEVEEELEQEQSNPKKRRFGDDDVDSNTKRTRPYDDDDDSEGEALSGGRRKRRATKKRRTTKRRRTYKRRRATKRRN